MKNILNRFFTKQEPQVTTRTSQYPAEVMEIHHAFETAGEALLAEAKDILKQCDSQSLEKGKRLMRAGFTQTLEAVAATRIIPKENNAKEIANLVLYYQHCYPNNKFITYNQVISICDKWNLICGGIDRFKGFVPEKNLREIESFRINRKDIADNLAYNIKGWSNGDTKSKIMAYLKNKYPNGVPVSLIGGSAGTRYIQISGISGHMWVESFNEIDGESRLICAPKKDMKLEGLVQFGKFFLSVNKKTFPDPVVLQPVKGGYLIVTAWGDEASDENVVNQKMN